ncbi:unnamed protein product [Closterium sp. NIES-54]
MATRSGNKLLEAICKGRRLQAMVDSGASHSVCDRGTLEKIGESLEETQFTALMLDGTKLPIHGEATMQLHIGALRWKPTLPITNIKGLDLILGRDFLKRFNPEIDWVNRKACIYNNGKRVELRSWTDTWDVPKTTMARFERTVNDKPFGAVSTMAGPEERGGRGAGGSGEAQAQGQPRDSAMVPVQPSLGPPRDEPRVFGLDKFNGENFAEWSFKMENIFDHYDLLEVMEGTEKRPENDPEKSPWVRKSAQGYLLLGQALGSSQIAAT